MIYQKNTNLKNIEELYYRILKILNSIQMILKNLLRCLMLEIMFENSGMKRLMAKFAQLEVYGN